MSSSNLAVNRKTVVNSAPCWIATICRNGCFRTEIAMLNEVWGRPARPVSRISKTSRRIIESKVTVADKHSSFQ